LSVLSLGTQESHPTNDGRSEDIRGDAIGRDDDYLLRSDVTGATIDDSEFNDNLPKVRTKMNDTTNLIKSSPNQSSPFDAIRGYRADGSEYWTARELTKWLGYTNWRNGEKAIKRAIVSCENQGFDATENIARTIKLSTRHRGAVVEIDDYELSRLACYLVAMNADPEKEMVAMAQGYFAMQTRKAEVVIPVQSDRIRELELELAIQTSINHRMAVQDTRIALHGLTTTLLLEGKADSVVEVDRPILEVIDNESGIKFSGQTTKQLADYLNKNGGRKFKSGAELERELNKLGRADLVDTVPRKTLQPFVSKENIKEACNLLINNRQQQLLG
jgi:hypothetical protein